MIDWEKEASGPLNAVVELSTSAGSFYFTDNEKIAERCQEKGNPSITPDELVALRNISQDRKIPPEILRGIHSAKKILRAKIIDTEEEMDDGGYSSKQAPYT